MRRSAAMVEGPEGGGDADAVRGRGGGAGAELGAGEVVAACRDVLERAPRRATRRSTSGCSVWTGCPRTRAPMPSATAARSRSGCSPAGRPQRRLRRSTPRVSAWRDRMRRRGERRRSGPGRRWTSGRALCWRATQALQMAAVRAGGHAVVCCSFGYAAVSSSGCGGGSGFTVHGYGTVVRLV